MKSLTNPLSSARSAAFQSFAQSANANTIALASQVPQALGTGFGYTMFDLRSIGNYEWAAAAPMEAALIYFVSTCITLLIQVIFSFYLALFQGMGRMKSGLHKKLRFSSILGLRLGFELLAYFFIVSLVSVQLTPVSLLHPCRARMANPHGQLLWLGRISSALGTQLLHHRCGRPGARDSPSAARNTGAATFFDLLDYL